MANVKPKLPKGFILWVGNRDMLQSPVKGQVDIIFRGALRRTIELGTNTYSVHRIEFAENIAWDHSCDSGDVIAYRKVTN